MRWSENLVNKSELSGGGCKVFKERIGSIKEGAGCKIWISQNLYFGASITLLWVAQCLE